MGPRYEPAASRRQSGVALVSVLLIVSVATALAYQMVSRQTLSIAQSRLALDGSQARQYALGGEQYARQVLRTDWQEPDSRNRDTLLEIWAKPLAAFEIEYGTIEVHIEDLGGRFNLNTVIGNNGAENLARLKRLLTHLVIDPDLADAWLDWIDDNQDVHGFGAEDTAHLGRNPAHRTANQRAVHISEFLLATAIEAEQFAQLRPYVTTLPVSSLRVNVNTASNVVLGILAPNYSPAQAQLFATGSRDFAKIETVIADHAELGASAGALTVRSEFFRVQVRVRYNDANSELSSVIHRDARSGNMTLLSRSFGERFGGERERRDAKGRRVASGR